MCVMHIYGNAQTKLLAAVRNRKCVQQLPVPKIIGFTMHLALIV